MLNRGEALALLLGRLFMAALFLPPGISKLLAFSPYAASLASKGLPYATIIAAFVVAAQALGAAALIAGAWPRWTALALIASTAFSLWLGHRGTLADTLLHPRENGEFFQTLAIIGGLLFYMASGPGDWSWRRGA